MNNQWSRELMHHGIQGMHWGIRRYQPYPSNYSGDGKFVGKQINDYSVTKSAMRGTPTKAKQKEVKAYRQKNFIEPFNQKLGRNGRVKTQESNVEIIDDIAINKGKSVYHVTGKNANQFMRMLENSGKRLFVASEEDKKKYAGFFAASKVIMDNFEKPVYQIELELKKDLKAPSHVKQVKMFTEFYDKNSDITKQALAEVYSNFYGKTVDEWKKTIANDFTKNTIQNEAYDAFIVGYGATAKAFSKDYYKAYELFSNFVKGKGYNAIIDENDKMDSYMLATKPLILLDTLNQVGMKNIREISYDEIYKNMVGDH